MVRVVVVREAGTGSLARPVPVLTGRQGVAEASVTHLAALVPGHGRLAGRTSKCAYPSPFSLAHWTG